MKRVLVMTMIFVMMGTAGCSKVSDTGEGERMINEITVNPIEIEEIENEEIITEEILYEHVTTYWDD